jgi:RimJ/RimL family protein N-acetyltransferase
LTIDHAKPIDLLDLYSDPAILMSVQSAHIPQNTDDAKAEINHLKSHEIRGSGIYWGLFDHEQLLGVFGLHSWDLHQQTIEISYEVHRDYRRQGLAFTTIKQCMNFAFENFQVDSILSKTLESNTASQGVVKKLGFVHLASENTRVFFNEQWHNRLTYAYTQPR